MIKEAGLFILSAGFLVYFISPVDDKPKPPPSKIETPQKAVSSDEDDAAYWGDESEDEAEQEFVFGEPMTGTDPTSDDDDGHKNDEDNRNREVAPKQKASANNGASRPERIPPAHNKSPKPGELGSAENPIPLN
ncbi:MAG: hypothetical protein V7676_09200 [Parasphingorhabdus sp.]|uniref:hypothetical protein n=1 Tax=Parasphingorhabdus sp. TaxID=2709688 RepID=UPI0030019E84